MSGLDLMTPLPMNLMEIIRSLERRDILDNIVTIIISNSNVERFENHVFKKYTNMLRIRSKILPSVKENTEKMFLLAVCNKCFLSNYRDCEFSATITL